MHMEMAYQADALTTVIRASQAHTHLDRYSRALHLFALSLIRLGKAEEAVGICRERVASFEKYPWVSGTILMARRLQGMYSGLSSENRDDSRDARSPAQHIPRRIVQFWDQGPPPDDVITTMQTWKTKNDGFECLLFSGKSASDFLRRTYGARHADAFALCYHPAMRSDFFRIAFLAAEGGVYVDADEECRSPLSTLLDSHSSKKLFLFLAPDDFFVNNNFIAVARGNTTLIRVLDRALERLEVAAGQGIRPDIWTTTGPGQVTRVIAEKMLSVDDDFHSFTNETAFLYWDERKKYLGERPGLAYKQTTVGNWRARPWEQPVANTFGNS